MASGKIETISVADIICDGNVRSNVDERQIDGLAQSIRQVGQLTPLRVRRIGSKYGAVDGMRRYLAALKLGLTTLDAIIEREDLDDAGALQHQVIGNCQRSDWPVMDKARGVDRLMRESGWNASETAAKLGFSVATVSRLLALLTLPEEIQDQVETGKLAASTAYELARVGDPAQQAALLQKAIQGSLTRDAATAQIKRRKTNRGSMGRRVVAALGAGQSVTAIGIDSTLDDFIACLEAALMRARKARSQGLALETFTKLLRDTAGRKGGVS